MFLQSSLPWQRCDPGKGKQGRKRPEKGLRGPYQELSTGPVCHKSQSVWPRRAPIPLEPHGQRCVGGHCPVLGCAGREPGREPLGKEFPDPSLVPLLSPALPVAAAGASLQRGQAWPGAQRGIGLSVTEGNQQTWWVQEPWRRMRWDPQAWVGRPPGTASPSCYLSPCWGNEDQATEAYIPAHGGLYPSPCSPIQQPGLGVEGPA